VKIAAVTICLLGTMLLTGCWDVKDAQYYLFVNELGIDYQNGAYIVNVQINEPSAMAKQKGNSPPPNPIIVGKATAPSLGMAMDEIEKISQVKLVWSQNKAVILTDNALRQGLRTLKDDYFHSRETRYTAWVYITDEPLVKVLNAKPITGSSSMATLTYQPKLTYDMQSLLLPKRLQHVFRSLGENWETIVIPKIGINEMWTKGGEKEKVTVLKGGVAITQGKDPKSFTESQIKGIRWLDPHAKNANLVMGDSKENTTILSLREPKIEQKFRREGDFILANYTITTKGFIRVQKENLTRAEIASKAETAIQNEIRETFDAANKQGVDIYNIKLGCYRQNIKPSDSIKLGNIVVKVSIESTGMRQK